MSGCDKTDVTPVDSHNHPFFKFSENIPLLRVGSVGAAQMHGVMARERFAKQCCGLGVRDWLGRADHEGAELAWSCRPRVRNRVLMRVERGTAPMAAQSRRMVARDQSGTAG
uniref:Uncharacterized protein n=1 Tax=Oryza barthii TaxID=65489 RepID=A0A0D3GN31_9ORYZ